MIRWLLAMFGCAASLVATAAEPTLPDADRKRDVIYCRKDGVCLTMDVFTPKTAKNGVGIVAVISGGWVSNHDSIELFSSLLGTDLIKRGYTVFAVVHGSQPKFTIPEAIADVHKAVRYIRTNAKEYGIDPHRIGITGASAGCHLSLMIALTGKDGDPKAKDPVDRMSSKVQAVAGFFPPTDFFNYGETGKSAEPLVRTGPFSAAFDFREQGNGSRNFAPVSDARRKEIMKEISPVYHVTSQAPPTLLIHGDKDTLVPLQQSELLVEKLKDAKVKCELVVVKGGGHGGPEIVKHCHRVADWFDTHLAKK